MGLSGEGSRQLWRVIHACILLLFGIGLSSCASIVNTTPETPTPTPQPDNGNITLSVYGKNNLQLSDGVTVRVSNSSLVDGNDYGEFRIGPCNPDQFIIVSAPDYEVFFQKCDRFSTSYPIVLKPLIGQDNINYSWRSAISYCGNCHNGIFTSTNEISNYNEVSEWKKSSHAQVFGEWGKRYFETMYMGTSISDSSMLLTPRTVINNELIRTPLLTDPRYHGPGYQLDFPNQAGNCSYCHAPATILSSQTSVDLRTLFPNPIGAAGEGVTCDICHKVLSVTLDENGFPLTDRPGILSFIFLRPNDKDYYIGPVANVNTRNQSVVDHDLICSPIFSKSEFCAACHYGKFGETMIYNSYGEWKASRYGDDPEESDYKTCQDCHMSYVDTDAELPPFSEREGCSETNLNFQEFNHNLMNFGMNEKTKTEIPQLIQEAATMDVKFKYEPDKKNALGVVVKVENTKAGHKFPTDSPLRHLILFVDVKDQLGMPLVQMEGERIPIWGGVGNKPDGMENYGGKPGKIFANLLVEKDTNISPTAAYWNPTKLAWVDLEKDKTSDTRLAPRKPDESIYFFSFPSNGKVVISVKLIYRFAFIDLAFQKGWVRPDIIVTSVECTIDPSKPDTWKCP